jgi:hypothetical protein
VNVDGDSSVTIVYDDESLDIISKTRWSIFESNHEHCPITNFSITFDNTSPGGVRLENNAIYMQNDDIKFNFDLMNSTFAKTTVFYMMACTDA